jgi:hypothetical protein
MAAQPPPPVVTITDPAAPGPLSDVIGQEPNRPQRRLTPAQRRVAWLCAIIVATTCGGIWAVDRIRTGQRLDRQALAEVSVVLSGGDVPALGTDDVDSLELIVLSTGRHPVTVLSARLGALGYPTMLAEDGRLRSDEPTTVTFRGSYRCRESMFDGLAAPIVLRVRTYRGDVKALQLLPDNTLRAALAVQIGDRCGLFSPADSLVRDAARGFPVGNDLIATVPLHNRARSQRTITSVTVNGGLQVVTVDTPYVLAARGDGSLSVRLRVADCSAALVTWAQPGRGSLDAAVAGDGVVETSPGLISAGDETLTTWIETICSG